MVSKRSGRRGDKPRIPTKDEMLRDLNKLFVEKFGREPGPDDPLFFDPDAETPIPLAASKLRAQMVITMMRAGTPEHLIYAYLRTGRLLTTKTYRKAPAEIRAEWDFAVEEYDRMGKSEKS
jgi:hypothetical protein